MLLKNDNNFHSLETKAIPLKETISCNEFTKIWKEIKSETELLPSSILQRHRQKYQRAGITTFSHQLKKTECLGNQIEEDTIINR